MDCPFPSKSSTEFSQKLEENPDPEIWIWLELIGVKVGIKLGESLIVVIWVWFGVE